MKETVKIVVWLRRDLRLSDHRAFAWAKNWCEKIESQGNVEVVPVFVFDEQILKHLPKNDKRLSFIYECLAEMDHYLRQENSQLFILKGNPTEVIPKFAYEIKARALVCAKDFESYAKKRDEAVQAQLKKLSISFFTVLDHVVKEPKSILNGEGGFYRVYTPYSKKWLSLLSQSDIAEANVEGVPWIKLERIREESIKGEWKAFKLKELSYYGFQKQENIIQGGEKAAQKSLKIFLNKLNENEATFYENSRNFVSMEGTSFLSPHLRFGSVSIRQLVRESLKSGKRAEKWLNELIWREFYQMLLECYPEVETLEFQEKYRGMKWPGKKEHFEKWRKGETGYPLIDAAMRYFNETGWMHNRLRMVVASFLTKDLLIDWRWGEEYFAGMLLDFDLASNNGGWQWAASVGADAQPYFRIFNPTSQAKRFDPEAEFILAQLPERRKLSRKNVFEPILPIVEHSVQSKKAIELFQKYASTFEKK